MDVLFAVMPFGDVVAPTIGVSLLQAGLARRRVSARVRHFALDFAAEAGLSSYELVSFWNRTLIGEWLFAPSVFGDRVPDAGRYRSEVLRQHLFPDGRPEDVPDDAEQFATGMQTAERLLALQPLCGPFVVRCAEEILSQRPSVVGFSLAFHQTNSSLAVARLLKQSDNPPVIVLGGPSCHGEMGLALLHAFPWVDYVCTGEGDQVFPELVETLLGRGTAPALPGLLKQGESVGVTSAPPVPDLDALPVPDYSDYFRELSQSPLRDKVGEPLLPVETARGCWWGAHQPCTFCGQNGTDVAFRSKSPGRALSETADLVRASGVTQVWFVENLVPQSYFQSFFPRLGESNPGLRFFCSVRANISYGQLRELQQAGARVVQPGIESLSNAVLRLMGKGTRGIHGIQILRWCRELDLGAWWNLIFGVPGEPPGECQRMAQWLPLLTHLEPPRACGRIRLDRFSAYHATPEALGVTNLRPPSPYAFAFPLDEAPLRQLASCFDFDYRDGSDPGTYARELRREASRWKAAWRGGGKDRPSLDLRQAGDKVTVTDTRPCAARESHRLTGLAAALYLACDTAQRPAALADRLGVSASSVRRALGRLEADRLVLEDEGEYLALAVYQNRWDRGGPASNDNC